MSLETVYPAGLADLDALMTAKYGSQVPSAGWACAMMQVVFSDAWAFYDREIGVPPIMLGGIFAGADQREAWFLEGPHTARRLKSLVRAIRVILDRDSERHGDLLMTRVHPLNAKGGKLAHLLGFRKTLRLSDGLLVWERSA